MLCPSAGITQVARNGCPVPIRSLSTVMGPMLSGARPWSVRSTGAHAESARADATAAKQIKRFIFDIFNMFPQQCGRAKIFKKSKNMYRLRCYGPTGRCGKSEASPYLCPCTSKRKLMSYNLLKGKRGLIFGALNDKSIAWKVAERAREEGAELVLTNTPVSIRMGNIGELAEKCGAVVIPADATSIADLENLIARGTEHLGGKFDFVLHSIGMSPNVRKGRTYDDLDYDYYHKRSEVRRVGEER